MARNPLHFANGFSHNSVFNVALEHKSSVAILGLWTYYLFRQDKIWRKFSSFPFSPVPPSSLHSTLIINGTTELSFMQIFFFYSIVFFSWSSFASPSFILSFAFSSSTKEMIFHCVPQKEPFCLIVFLYIFSKIMRVVSTMTFIIFLPLLLKYPTFSYSPIWTSSLHSFRFSAFRKLPHIVSFWLYPNPSINDYCYMTLELKIARGIKLSWYKSVSMYLAVCLQTFIELPDRPYSVRNKTENPWPRWLAREVNRIQFQMTSMLELIFWWGTPLLFT